MANCTNVYYSVTMFEAPPFKVVNSDLVVDRVKRVQFCALGAMHIGKLS